MSNVKMGRIDFIIDGKRVNAKIAEMNVDYNATIADNFGQMNVIPSHTQINVNIKRIVKNDGLLYGLFNSGVEFDIVAYFVKVGKITFTGCRVHKYKLDPQSNNGVIIETAVITPKTELFGSGKKPIPPLQTFVFR